MKFLLLSLPLLFVSCVDTRSPKNDACYSTSGEEIECSPYREALRVGELTIPYKVSEREIILGTFDAPTRNENFLCGIAVNSGKRYSYSINDRHLEMTADGITVVFAKEGPNQWQLPGKWVALKSNDPRLKGLVLQFGKKLIINSVCE